jgi:hypothetical protein
MSVGVGISCRSWLLIVTGSQVDARYKAGVVALMQVEAEPSRALAMA